MAILPYFFFSPFYNLFIYFSLTLHSFHTPHLPHSAFSTLRIFHTPHFPHCAFSTLHIFYTPHFPHSALRTPHSALRVFHLTHLDFILAKMARPPDSKTSYFMPLMGSKNKPTKETFDFPLSFVAHERLCLSSLLTTVFFKSHERAYRYLFYYFIQHEML